MGEEAAEWFDSTLSRMSRHLTHKDVQRFGLDGDPDFSEAHNRAVIKETIRKTEENYRKRRKEVDEGIQERSDLIMSYMRHQLDNKREMDITEYAGWEEMKRLSGITRVEELQRRARERGLL